MIRYSTYGRTNYRTPTPRERALAEQCRERTHADPLAEEYRELQELRERVKRLEAAAAARLEVAQRNKILKPDR
jgi:hypothetical protein